MISKTNDTKFIIIQVILTLSIALIPTYFYIDASFENKNIKDKLMLKNYASSVILKMKDFEEENNEIFHFPRSNIFKSAVYDKEGKALFSLFDNDEHPIFYTQYLETTNKIYYKQYLSSNKFNVNYIIVSKKINHSQTIYNVIILLLSITCLMFLSSFFTIKQSIEPYKKLHKYLDNFIKDAMHELKTPIGVAMINIDMLQMKLNDDKHIRRIKSALKSMSVVYEDLEYYMQENRVKNDKKNIHLSNFLTKRVEFFDDLTTAKNIELLSDIEDNIDIYFNEIELYRIIDNSLSNAIKYSKDKSTIKVILKKTVNTIELIFKDQGIGIKDTNKIFERYYREDKISGGFGIGLNIVKNICIKNNIKCEVTSAPNIGSRFCYTFTL